MTRFDLVSAVIRQAIALIALAICLHGYYRSGFSVESDGKTIATLAAIMAASGIGGQAAKAFCERDKT